MIIQNVNLIHIPFSPLLGFLTHCVLIQNITYQTIWRDLMFSTQKLLTSYYCAYRTNSLVFLDIPHSLQMIFFWNICFGLYVCLNYYCSQLNSLLQKLWSDWTTLISRIKQSLWDTINSKKDIQDSGMVAALRIRQIFLEGYHWCYIQDSGLAVMEMN